MSTANNYKSHDFHKYVFWLYGVIIGLVIKDAISKTLPHILMSSDMEPKGSFTEAARLFVTLFLVIRFYLGSAIYFEDTYYNSENNMQLSGKDYMFDFLFGFIHFLFFFGLVETIDVHNRPARAFLIMLAVILLYDIIWYLICRKRDHKRLVLMWTGVNVFTCILGGLIYFMSTYFHMSELHSQAIALIPVVIFSIIDMAELVTGKRIISSWLTKMIPP